MANTVFNTPQNIVSCRCSRQKPPARGSSSSKQQQRAPPLESTGRGLIHWCELPVTNRILALNALAPLLRTPKIFGFCKHFGGMSSSGVKKKWLKLNTWFQSECQWFCWWTDDDEMGGKSMKVWFIESVAPASKQLQWLMPCERAAPDDEQGIAVRCQKRGRRPWQICHSTINP